MINNSILQQQALVKTLQLPKHDLITFNGDPLDYWPFMRSFENTVDAKTSDDSVKLSSLIQYSGGKVKKLLQCCLVMEPKDGYKRALELLKDRFGDDNMIAQAWVNKIVRHPDVKGVENIRDYADVVSCCYETLQSMKFISELENRRSMKMIIEKLPVYLQHRWQKENYNIKTKKSRNPELNDVVKFITAAADESSDPVFGNLCKNKIKYNERSRIEKISFSVQGASTTQHSNGINSAAQTVVKSIEPCPYCGQKHYITQCQSFKALRIKDRVSAILERKLCVNCFKSGHIGRDCTRPFTCNINGCGKKHSKFLHLPTRNERDTSPKTVLGPAVQFPPATNVLQSNFIKAKNGKVALPIVAARVRGENSALIDIYALIDPGGTNCYCTDKLAKLVGARRQNCLSELTTIEQKQVIIKSEVVNFQIANLEDTCKFDLKKCDYSPIT